MRRLYGSHFKLICVPNLEVTRLMTCQGEKSNGDNEALIERTLRVNEGNSFEEDSSV